MIGDIRLSVGFDDHPKVRRLTRELGDQAGFGLVRIWLHTAKYYPKGHLDGMTEADLEEIAKWRGKRGKFSSMLIEVGLIDINGNGGLSIHDWKDHQRWAYHSDERKEAARRSADARWNRIRGNAE